MSLFAATGIQKTEDVDLTRYWLRRESCFVCAAVAMTVAGCSASSRIVPRALAPGDTIAIVAPASPAERNRVELATKRLEDMGYHVKTRDDLFRTRGYLGGSDEERAAELMAAFADPEVRAVFAARGGYGSMRILDHLDFDTIRRNPKILVGFSDITSLHLAIGRMTGLITFHGPLAMYGLGSEKGMDSFTERYLWRAICGDTQDAEQPGGYAFDLTDADPPVEALVGGVGRGRLTGGNLSLIAALTGTPYEIDTEGAVLFIEDDNEQPYRIDRYLSQLKLAGKLDRPAAVILGRFTNCAPAEGEPSLTLDEVLHDYFDGIGVPVICNFPAGHGGVNATLPMGAFVEVDADKRTVTVLQEPVCVDTTE